MTTRRGFLGALAALVAAPKMARALEPEPNGLLDITRATHPDWDANFTPRPVSASLLSQVEEMMRKTQMAVGDLTDYEFRTTPVMRERLYTEIAGHRPPSGGMQTLMIYNFPVMGVRECPPGVIAFQRRTVTDNRASLQPFRKNDFILFANNRNG